MPVTARGGALVVVATILSIYFLQWAQQLLIPIVLAILLSFALTPVAAPGVAPGPAPSPRID